MTWRNKRLDCKYDESITPAQRKVFAGWLLSPQLWPQYMTIMQRKGLTRDDIRRVQRTLERMAASGERDDMGQLVEALRSFAAELA